MRLSSRRTSVAQADFLVHHYLWRNLEAALEQVKLELPARPLLVLDVGCGRKPYADLFSGSIHFGLNNTLEDATADVVGDATKLPIASQSVDLVFCSQVLEHVPHPRSVVRECFRVLRQGGWLVLSAPFYWPLHEEPHDYFRFTRHGLEHLIKDAGFTRVDVRADGGDHARLCLSMIQALPRWIGWPLRIPLNVLGMVMDRVSHHTRLPMNYTVLACADSGTEVPTALK